MTSPRKKRSILDVPQPSPLPPSAYNPVRSLGPEFTPEESPYNPEFEQPLTPPVPVPERFPTSLDVENAHLELEYWKARAQAAKLKWDLSKPDIAETVEKGYRDYIDAMRLSQIMDLLDDKRDDKLTLEQAIRDVKDFLVSAGWKVYTINSAEPVYRIVVNGSIFEPKKEMEILIDQKGHYIKLGVVNDLR